MEAEIYVSLKTEMPQRTSGRQCAVKMQLKILSGESLSWLTFASQPRYSGQSVGVFTVPNIVLLHVKEVMGKLEPHLLEGAPWFSRGFKPKSYSERIKIFSSVTFSFWSLIGNMECCVQIKCAGPPEHRQLHRRTNSSAGTESGLGGTASPHLPGKSHGFPLLHLFFCYF